MSGCGKITAEDLFEVFDLGDMPYNIGRSNSRNVDFTLLNLDLTNDSLCTYYMAGLPAFVFNGKSGRHTYAIYPQLSPVYAYAKITPDDTDCTCIEKK